MEKDLLQKLENTHRDNGCYPNPASISIHITQVVKIFPFLPTLKKSLPPASHRGSVNNRLHQLRSCSVAVH